MDREKRKIEQLHVKHEQLKKKVKDWEIAIYKTEGRKPDKNDMKTAPSHVQESYRELVKIRKYLEESLSKSTRKADAALTPGKIFLGGKHRRQLQRTDHAYLTRTPIHKSKAPQRQLKESPKNPTLGLRSTISSSSSSDKKAESPAGPSNFPFKKLFSKLSTNVEPVVSKSLDKTKQNASSSAAAPEPSKSTPQTIPVQNTALRASPTFSTLQDNVKSLLDSEDHWSDLEENMVDGDASIMSSPEKVPQEKEFRCFTHTPFNTLQNGVRPLRFSENRWCVREDAADLDPSKSIYEKPQQDSGFGSGSPFNKSQQECARPFQDSENLPSIPDDFGGVEASKNTPEVMEQDTDSRTCTLVLVDTLIERIRPVLDSENSSSVPEDFGSMQSASSPMVVEENSSSFQGSEDSEGSRKRPFSFAFSPSPEKPKQTRKFFKSSRGERAKPLYSMGSYKPPSPKKKFKNTPEPSPSFTKTRRSARVNAASAQEVVGDSKELSSPQSSDKNAADKSLELEEAEKVISKKKVDTKKRSVRAKKKVNYEEPAAEDSNELPPTKKSHVVDIFDESVQPVRTIKKKGRRFNARNQTLESKISSGKLEDNYVRIDTTKKVFVRGHKKISAVKMKRLDWKHRKSAQGKESVQKSFTCHKCGEKGHFAKFCGKDAVSTEEAPGEEDNSPFPTLQEAARMVYKNASNNPRVNMYTSQSEPATANADDDAGIEAPMEDSMNDTMSFEQPDVDSNPKLLELVEPFFGSEDAPDEDQVMKEGMQAFGYDSFRPGQKEAIQRVLKGLSTLLILSTGSGKSLCYQLPAYLYQQKYPGAMTLCVSPLVSLMEDQVQGIPPFLNAACLHGGMTAKQKSVVLDKIKARKLNILLVSPEAVCGGLFGLFRGSSDNLPKISFACIDEVHCVSQWSHNFRPSYLQLCKILREKLNVKTILGLTATATETTARSICEHLNIDPSTTIRGELIPRNLQLSASRDVYKDEALLNLLRGDRFRDCDSIIVYCTRREECERIASLLRTKMQEISTRKIIKSKTGARLSGSCEAYHAGMTPRRRKNVQEGFMSGNIRIVVATVAFGMGIDKSDIRAVIHYNMPSAFESYVQEIGRAGRDGLPAHCHLFLDNSRRNDLCELKRHVYANSVDRPTIRKLLRKVFQPCKCKKIEELKGNTEAASSNNATECPGHEVSFSIEKIVTELDLPKENITTLLCYLELGEKKWIEILPLTYEMCTIQSYVGAKQLKAAAAKCPPLAVAIALEKEKNTFRDTDAFVKFNIIEAAATVGWNSSVVKKELKNLEWAGSQFDASGNATRFRKSGLLVEFSELAYRLKSPGSLSDDEADEVLNSLHGRNVKQEQTELYQLQRVYQALLSISLPNVNNLCDTFDEEKSEQLKKFIYEYFNETCEAIQIGTDAVHSLEAQTQLDPGKEEELRRTVRRLIDSNRDVNFTTRSIARIFQGISSPCFPADVWYRNRDFWRRFLDVDFHVICKIAAQEL